METPSVVWTPDSNDIADAHITEACQRLGIPDYDAFYRWSVDNPAEFWGDTVAALGIRFRTQPNSVVDLRDGVAHPVWFPGATLNIAESCFLAPDDATAVVLQREGAPIERVTYGELDRLSNRVAVSLSGIGLLAGNAIAIAMPMTLEAVAAYIGIVKAGCVVVSIADSFAPEEIATRLRIANASAVITQDVILRAGKTLPMYQKVVDAGATTIVVVSAGDQLAVPLREGDREWSTFLGDATTFSPVAASPDDTTNLLFSSGTTGDPKAIPWSHTTPIKCAMDGYYHHNIKPGDVVAWPTNLGWMMGPWLIYASLINRGTIALYYGAPNTVEFCRFVQDARVQMLGVVPSLVKAWRAGSMTDGLDWNHINAFSSTGEASNADVMSWLMMQAGNRPVVEYCGGTEIGGGYVTQTLVQPAIPSTFSTPALGMAIHVLDGDGKPTSDGELFITPPSIGLSLSLLGRDHDEVYFEGTPPGPNGEQLRRHGDQVGHLENGYYRALGRSDDTMNLGGIKISSAELERAVNTVDGVVETAAIAVDPPGGGPSRLVVFAVLEGGAPGGSDSLRKAMQKAIATTLNPLFRVHDVVPVEALPRTASNKVMRRVLRDQYQG